MILNLGSQRLVQLTSSGVSSPITISVKAMVAPLAGLAAAFSMSLARSSAAAWRA